MHKEIMQKKIGILFFFEKMEILYLAEIIF